MEYSEENINLFDTSEEYFLVHCISRDAKMGAGIAKEFVRRYPELKALRNMGEQIKVGDCVLRGRVFNLITKEKYWDKPTYATLTKTLKGLKEQTNIRETSLLAMPKIGCGLDKLEWNKVREIIKEVFKDTEVEIKVCYL